MANTTLNTRIKLKYDSYSNWTTKNPVLMAGEVAVCTVEASTGAVKQEPAVLFKVGDGTKAFKDLPWVSGKAADVTKYALDTDAEFESQIKSWARETVGVKYRIVETAENSDIYKLQVSNSNSSGVWSDWTDVGDNSVQVDVKTVVDAVSALTTRVDTAESDIDTLEGKVGAATDTASATGSLYARIKQEASDRDSKITSTIQGLDADKSSAAVDTGKGLQVTVKEVDGKIDSVSVSGDYSETYDVKGAADTAVGNFKTNVTGTPDSGKTLQTEIDDLETLVGSTSVAIQIKNATDALDSTVKSYEGDTAPTTGIAVTVTETDGKLSAVTANIPTGTYDIYGDAAQALADAKTYTNGITGTPDTGKTLQDEVDALENLVGSTSVADQIKTETESLDSSVSQTAGDDSLALSVTEVDGKLTAISGSILVNQKVTSDNKIATINDIKSLGQALEYIGSRTKASEEESDEAALEAISKAKGEGYPKAGSVAIVVDYGKSTGREFIYDGTKWQEFGNQDLYETKTQAAADIKTAVDALDVTDLASTGGSKVSLTLNEVDGKVTSIAVIETDIASAKDLSDETSRAEGVEGTLTSLTTTAKGNLVAAINEVDANADANTTAIDVLNGSDTTAGSVAKSIKDSIDALDKSDTAVDHKFVTAVSETDGIISVSRGAITTDDLTQGTNTLVFDCGTSTIE